MAVAIEQTSEKISDSRWNWEIHLKGEPDDLEKIEFVEYTLHPTFLNPVRKIFDKTSGFKLKTSGWGTFPVYVRIKLKDEKELKESFNLSFDKEIMKKLQI
ncbi:MAG: hypothetical protein JWQ09_6081 [Segetibacter sp.]|nr:hypothetical protein [Segetibacter sp.]